MQKMTPEEEKAFLLSGTRTGKLATVRADGRPHVAPVWFLLDGDDVIFTTWHESVKAHNIQRDPRVSLCVDDDTPPFSFVIVEGTAVIEEDLTALREWSTRLGGRYMGADQAEAFGARNGVPGELLVRITPTKIISRKDMAA
ncbi:MAG: PPOX class F420-dependent oxidoreductase [Ardenticatenaceae bacterium]|nr:PPOX class F420-dependent oxidoreductase [Ardenticatenaceae bacterium]